VEDCSEAFGCLRKLKEKAKEMEDCREIEMDKTSC
jgi:hypothetical protein